jgi:hypothetical protein
VCLVVADGCIDDALVCVQSENATAFFPADLEAIRALVVSKPGGFSQLNSTVKKHFHRWFEGQGAVRSAERISRRGDRNRWRQAVSGIRTHSDSRGLSDEATPESSDHAASHFYVAGMMPSRNPADGDFIHPTRPSQEASDENGGSIVAPKFYAAGAPGSSVNAPLSASPTEFDAVTDALLEATAISPYTEVFRPATTEYYFRKNSLL